FQMNESKRLGTELKFYRLKAHLRSHKTAISDNENKFDEENLQRIMVVQKQLETVVDNLLADCPTDSQCEARIILTKLKDELLLIHLRVLHNHKNPITEDNSYAESNIYEEEATSMMMQQQQKRGGMSDLAKEMKDKAEVSLQLENDISNIEAIFSDLHHIVHEQGDFIDSIEENVESCVNDVKRGQRDLREAVQHKGRTTTMTAAMVGGVVVGAPAGVTAGSAIVGILGTIGGVVTGFIGGNWFNKHAKKDAQE
ncbi:hypothetical protein PENTCL1PPCAC_22877, partial [Pristionchus entomophagus]